VTDTGHSRLQRRPSPGNRSTTLYEATVNLDDPPRRPIVGIHSRRLPRFAQTETGGRAVACLASGPGRPGYPASRPATRRGTSPSVDIPCSLTGHHHGRGEELVTRRVSTCSKSGPMSQTINQKLGRLGEELVCRLRESTGGRVLWISLIGPTHRSPSRHQCSRGAAEVASTSAAVGRQLLRAPKDRVASQR
jgi:hypothetical protein